MQRFFSIKSDSSRCTGQSMNGRIHRTKWRQSRRQLRLTKGRVHWFPLIEDTLEAWKTWALKTNGSKVDSLSIAAFPSHFWFISKQSSDNWWMKRRRAIQFPNENRPVWQIFTKWSRANRTFIEIVLCAPRQTKRKSGAGRSMTNKIQIQWENNGNWPANKLSPIWKESR